MTQLRVIELIFKMYYPKSQIKSNLYTNGDKYALSTTEEIYIGYYYSTSGGTNYTGKYPNDGKNILLIPIIPPSSNKNETDNDFSPSTIMVQNVPMEEYSDYIGNIDNNVTYASLSPNQESVNRSLPTPSQPSPTPGDYVSGYFDRYFVKKNNEAYYFEISTVFYNLLKNQDESIAFELYSCIDIEWKITGPFSNVFSFNKSTIKALEREKVWPGFYNSFEFNFSKFHLGS